MHYYQFNIGDYSKSTKHLTPLEDIAYRRMLDLHYDTEKPLPCEIASIARLIVMRENQEEIRQVLNEFWCETEEGWINKRASEDIDAYKEKSEKAKKSAEARWAKQKDSENNAKGMRTHSDSNANHKPLTINQELNNDSSNEQSHPTELVEKAFHHFWGVWKQTKKDIGKVDTSPKESTFEKKWKPMFNKAYFKTHTIEQFKQEVSDICQFVVDAHNVDGFNRFENMQTGKFFNEKQWRDK